MRVTTIRDFVRLAALKSQWDELAAARTTPLLQHAWFYSCARAFHDEADLRVTVIEDDHGNVQAIAPLVKRRSWCGLDRLEALGAASLYEPIGFLYRSSAGRSRLLSALADQGQCIALQRYWLDDDEDFHLSTHSLKGRWIRRAANESGYLEIPTDRPDARASLSPRRRYDLRRANRRARDMGGLNYSIAIPTSENASSLLDLAATIEDKSWKGRAKSSIRSNKKMLEFLQLYTRECVPSKVMRFLFLYIGNEPASMAICAQSRTALWFLKIGYDERFSSCSPGLLLLVKATQYCIEEGLTRIEHLGADEPWLSPWTTGVRRYANVRYYPQSLNGIIAFSHDTIRFGLSRATRLLKLWRSSLRSSQHSIVRSS